MPPENSAVVPIAPFHDRKSFNCGKRSMNDFLVDCGLSEAYGATWVLAPDPASPHVMAYYTIWPDPHELAGENYEEEIDATVITLERLAVDQQYQGKGIGRFLLARVIAQTVGAAETQHIDALHLDALDAEAKSWYLHLGLGFQEAAPGSQHLLLSVETMRRSLGL